MCTWDLVSICTSRGPKHLWLEKIRTGRILLAADPAYFCAPMGRYEYITAVLNVGGVADCLVGMFIGKAREEILDRDVEVRRDIDKRSINNLERAAKSDPLTIVGTDHFLVMLKKLERISKQGRSSSWRGCELGREKKC